jgi:hypothetical protein
MGLLVEFDESAIRQQLVRQLPVFFVRAVAPVNLVGLGQFGYLVDPCLQFRVCGHAFTSLSCAAPAGHYSVSA